MMAEGEKMMGFMPNDGLTMARVPGLVGAMLDLTGVIYRPGLVDIETKRLVAVMNSSAAGCNYCRGHTLFGALRQGIGREKLDAIWAYETSEVFTPAERSALRIAHLSALQPNQVEDRHFEDLKQYYTEDQAAEIIAVIALFGFLNRWNDTIKTELEDQPARTALAD
jgi:alkylhydroperoxidase family enzyme